MCYESQTEPNGDFSWVLPHRKLSKSPNLPCGYCPSFLAHLKYRHENRFTQRSLESTYWILVLFPQRSKSRATPHLWCLSLLGSPQHHVNKHVLSSSGVWEVQGKGTDKVGFILKPFLLACSWLPSPCVFIWPFCIFILCVLPGMCEQLYGSLSEKVATYGLTINCPTE